MGRLGPHELELLIVALLVQLALRGESLARRGFTRVLLDLLCVVAHHGLRSDEAARVVAYLRQQPVLLWLAQVVGALLLHEVAVEVFRVGPSALDLPAEELPPDNQLNLSVLPLDFIQVKSRPGKELVA